MSKAAQRFGRDEMAALLGDGMQEALTKPVGWKTKNGRHDEKDVSTLSVAETAALLKERDAQKQLSSHGGSVRLRAYKSNHVLQYQALLQEQQEQLSRSGSNRAELEEDESEDETFTHQKKQGKHREKAEPQVLFRRQKVEPEIVLRRIDDSSQSSGSEDDEEKPPPVRKRRFDSSSSSEDEDDKRRALLLAKRRQAREDKPDEMINEVGVTKPSLSVPTDNRSLQQEKENSASGSSGDTDSDSSEESSSEEEEIQVEKPLFVPKHRRSEASSKDNQKEEDRKAKEAAREEKRKHESRMMVAHVIAAEGISSASQVEVDDEAGGATNDPPNDDDPTDPFDRELERDAWEVRELMRLLETEDLRESREAAQSEYERRKLMTDQERIEEDIAMGLYKKPGEQRHQVQRDGENKHMQRYYHRGAFYMDDEEWTADDIRRKAKEYERAATGEDKIDKSKLPKVMQVKGFGLAKMGTKYKGLSKEDTTDKQMEMLPLAKKAKTSNLR